MVNIPLVLTLIRLIIAPIILPFLLVFYLPYNNISINFFLTCIFLLFGLTDFLDGYIARSYNSATKIGQLLDPLADKCLLYSTLLALVAVGKLYFFWALIMIGREFWIMGLREIALMFGFSVPVNRWGKIKTIFQIICLAFIILNPFHGSLTVIGQWVNLVEFVLLSVTSFLTIYSLYCYFRQFYQKLRYL